MTRTVNQVSRMHSTKGDSPREPGRRLTEMTARLTWVLLAGWTATAVAAWLVVAVTDGGLFNLPWVIGPTAVITILGYVVWRQWADIVEKRMTCAGLGFALSDSEEEQDIAAGIEAMFDARANAVVLGTRVILPEMQCWLAEVTETLSRDSEENVSRTSTVCLFENTGEQSCGTPPFRLEPHSSVARMLFRSLSAWFSRPHRAGFYLWYDAAPDEDSELSEFLSPDMQDWLGRHSRWSQLQPWTVVHSGKRTLIYRAGTAYEKLKYAQFVSELQTFARLWSAAVETMNRERVTVSGSLHSENDRHPLDVQSSRTELDQLLDQAPVRNLTPYWRMRTRIEPVLLVLCVFLGCLSAGFASGKLVTWIHRVTGIVLDQSWGIVMAVVLAGVIAVVACRQHWWSHRRNRRLLKTGEVTSGGVDHFTERNGNRSQDASLYQVQVTYNALDATHTAKWSLFVSDVRAAALTRTAEVDRQVVVLFDPSRPDSVVLPELLAFCR